MTPEESRKINQDIKDMTERIRRGDKKELASAKKLLQKAGVLDDKGNLIELIKDKGE